MNRRTLGALLGSLSYLALGTAATGCAPSTPAAQTPAAEQKKADGSSCGGKKADGSGCGGHKKKGDKLSISGDKDCAGVKKDE
jgi:hypothetical protein